MVQEYINRVRGFLLSTKADKRIIDKLAAEHGLQYPTIIKEFTELAIVLECRDVVKNNRDKGLQWVYNHILSIYKNQVNLSHRTSQSIMLQQYSTPAPIAYLAGEYILNKITNDYLGSIKRGGRFTKNHFTLTKHKAETPTKPEYQILEPSAGNGLLTICFKPENVFVNEIDDLRHNNLKSQPFMGVSKVDATRNIALEMNWSELFDGVITNPPFGTLERERSLRIIDSNGKELAVYNVKHLDHIMAIHALDCMKDNGAAAIIIGGHTNYDKRGRIQAGKNRAFLSYLYHYYNVDDVINIDGSLYSRQGTSFDVRLILISGRKEKPGGFPPMKNDDVKPIESFEDLFDRVTVNFTNVNTAQKRQDEAILNYKGEIWQRQLNEVLQSEAANLVFSKTYPKWISDNVDFKVIDKRTGKQYSHYNIIAADKQGIYAYGKMAHKKIVEKALQDGKNVPFLVLMDYHELSMKQAYELGIKAFSQGIIAVPVRDKQLMELIADIPVGYSEKIFKQWYKGWTFANLKEPVVSSAEQKPQSRFSKTVEISRDKIMLRHEEKLKPESYISKSQRNDEPDLFSQQETQNNDIELAEAEAEAMLMELELLQMETSLKGVDEKFQIKATFDLIPTKYFDDFDHAKTILQNYINEEWSSFAKIEKIKEEDGYYVRYGGITPDGEEDSIYISVEKVELTKVEKIISELEALKIRVKKSNSTDSIYIPFEFENYTQIRVSDHDANVLSRFNTNFEVDISSIQEPEEFAEAVYDAITFGETQKLLGYQFN